jgi:hypothetical protein
MNLIRQRIQRDLNRSRSLQVGTTFHLHIQVAELRRRVKVKQRWRERVEASCLYDCVSCDVYCCNCLFFMRRLRWTFCASTLVSRRHLVCSCQYAWCHAAVLIRLSVFVSLVTRRCSKRMVDGRRLMRLLLACCLLCFILLLHPTSRQKNPPSTSLPHLPTLHTRTAHSLPPIQPPTSEPQPTTELTVNSQQPDRILSSSLPGSADFPLVVVIISSSWILSLTALRALYPSYCRQTSWISSRPYIDRISLTQDEVIRWFDDPNYRVLCYSLSPVIPDCCKTIRIRQASLFEAGTEPLFV